jgi:hypothetical protein
MRKLLLAALLPAAALAQGFQNHEIVFEGGAAWTSPRTLGGTGIRVDGSTGFGNQYDYGYQIARESATTLMLDVSFLFGFPGSSTGGALGVVDNSFNTITAGFRYMVPVHSRVTFFPVAGGGMGHFQAATVRGGDAPTFSSHYTTHGVFQFGGGADVRLTRRISLRAEVRDAVSGRNLGGASGRHHVVPLFGVALHF